MDYQTAKELKDAGFPQRSRVGSILTKDGAPPQTDEDYAYQPTLSALIEACGEDFHMVGHLNKTEWIASIGKWEETEYEGKREQYLTTTGTNGRGQTPEVACAKLWLALNQPPAHTK